MITKKIKLGLGLAVLLAAITVVRVLAGSSFDFGELAGAPPEGEANWTAWPTLINMEGGRPNEIITEDHTNCELGENIGYSEYGDGDTNIEWWMQVENLLTPIPTDKIQMMFGGLGSHSGTLWYFEFEWDPYTYFQTDHGVVPVQTTEGNACPILYDPIDVEGNTTYRFFGAPGTYHVYRSQNGSGADNGASNGQYFYLTTEDTNSIGLGSFVDNTTEESWYVVIQADPETNAIIGCHSEPVEPTSVSLSDFSASYTAEKTAIELAWRTASEVDILGFNVLRSTNEVGAQVQINDDQITVDHPGQTDGSSYSLDDYGVTIGQTYYYWIELIKTDGSRESVGPEAAFAGFQLFLPFIN